MKTTPPQHDRPNDAMAEPTARPNDAMAEPTARAAWLMADAVVCTVRTMPRHVPTMQGRKQRVQLVTQHALMPW
jgi:hypothetical protein